ncbi:MAG: hypothetical protein KKD33_02330, partial [Verrucomicrobia bacterium]|nr:hypothetical protein [Verrucomicrobiota bacterium]
FGFGMREHFEDIRGCDQDLLRLWGVRHIVDFMIEKYVRKAGLTVTSSEKVLDEYLNSQIVKLEVQAMPISVPMPTLPILSSRDNKCINAGKDLRAGFTLEVRFNLDRLTGGQVLLDNRTPEGNGFCLRTSEKGTLELILGDGRAESRWECDLDLLGTNRDQHVVVIVDGGPKLILFVVDGVLCDGGEHRQFGWGRYNPNLRTPQGGPALHIANGLD